MDAREITVGIGGAAGDGQAATGDTLALVAARLGQHLYIYNSYQSVIRGGHVWLRLRISDKPLPSHGDRLGVVVALNQDTIDRHRGDLEEGGVLLYNADKLKAGGLAPGRRALPFPVRELTQHLGILMPVQHNTVLLGGLVHLLGFPFEGLAEAIGKQFAKKGEGVVRQNQAVARAGYDHAAGRFPPLPVVSSWSFTHRSRPVLTGNEAIAMGAVAAGCRWYSAYPMTPASGILHWFAAHAEKCGVVVKQAEDELAVVNMAIGAGHAGLRAMCGTSGGGFALMTEAIGMAGMIETPVVVVNVMRAGPSTGVPTKTEQADLNQVLGASQGEYPRAILAPTDTVDAFRTMETAFNWAERYQMPVIVVSDLLLSEHHETVDPDQFDFRFRIDRGAMASGDEGEGYLRYRITEDGVSPRVFPGTPGTEFVAPTDEHDERGITVSDVYTHPPTRRKMMDKRMRKVERLRSEIPAPALEGPPEAPLTLIGWGSTRGAIAEAAEILGERGIQVNRLQFRVLAPFPEERSTEVLKRLGKTLVVENNGTGQFARYLRGETGYRATGHVLKYDGEPFAPREIVQAVEEFLTQGGPDGFRHVSETPDALPTAYRRGA